MKRTFIAIKIDAGDTLKMLLSELRLGLKNSKIKWVDPENMHITLAFIGNTSVKDLYPIQQILKSVCRNHMAFPLVFRSVEVYRTLSDLRVIWLGIKESYALENLRESICDRLMKEGLFNDTRPFKPHLTLGRPKLIGDADKLIDIISRTRDETIQSIMVENVRFYESILNKEGPVYKTISTINLARIQTLLL